MASQDTAAVAPTAWPAPAGAPAPAAGVVAVVPIQAPKPDTPPPVEATSGRQLNGRVLGAVLALHAVVLLGFGALDAPLCRHACPCSSAADHIVAGARDELYSRGMMFVSNYVVLRYALRLNSRQLVLAAVLLWLVPTTLGTWLLQVGAPSPAIPMLWMLPPWLYVGWASPLPARVVLPKFMALLFWGFGVVTYVVVRDNTSAATAAALLPMTVSLGEFMALRLLMRCEFVSNGFYASAGALTHIFALFAPVLIMSRLIGFAAMPRDAPAGALIINGALLVATKLASRLALGTRLWYLLTRRQPLRSPSFRIAPVRAAYLGAQPWLELGTWAVYLVWAAAGYDNSSGWLGERDDFCGAAPYADAKLSWRVPVALALEGGATLLASWIGRVVFRGEVDARYRALPVTRHAVVAVWPAVVHVGMLGLRAGVRRYADVL